MSGLNRERFQDIEYSENGGCNQVRYSADWLKPSKHVYRPARKIGLIARLIRWIAGF